MKFSDINIRDPFVLVYDGKYYLYGTRAENTWEEKPLETLGFDVYESDDFENWSEPKQIFGYYDGFWGKTQYWAPEVHYYKGKFYLFATFAGSDSHRGTAIMVCDTPNGTFKEHSQGAVTPKDWECLDGTFYVEDETPYIVFCHEWTQIKDGEVCALELTNDLKSSVGKPQLLWKASEPDWRYDIRDNGSYVTDGPFLVKADKELLCLWSSFSRGEYVQAISYSDNGKLFGKWAISENLIYEKDGGHGMYFTDLKGENYFIFHYPNETPKERPTTEKITIDELKKKALG